MTEKTRCAWRDMKRRCDNPEHPSYKYYGERGIAYDEAWILYSTFLYDMGEAPEGLTLERKDNDKGYNKDNCCWVTQKEQVRNRAYTKATPDIAATIRTLYAVGDTTQKALGKMFGMSRGAVCHIISGKHWQ